MKKLLYVFVSLLLTLGVEARELHGTVLDDKGEPLVGATVVWQGTAVGTTTNILGEFTIRTVGTTHNLITSFVGYHPDTTDTGDHFGGALSIILVSDAVLDEVTIIERKMSVLRSRYAAFDVQSIDGNELCKAACCNLSEAFETNASVDVAYADAATGAKTIRLLGLSGTYVQLLSENTPGVRGLAQNFGMEYIPGSWMSSIQVSKGTASVINGYEATTGQINVEFLKPQLQDPFSFNIMINSEAMAELNIEGGWKVKNDLYTGIMAHYQNGLLHIDDNKDCFVDIPMSHNANLANRWFYKKNYYTLIAYARGLYDKRMGGQMGKNAPANPYRIDLNTWRIDGFMKNGFIFDRSTSTSLGIITAGSYHNQQNMYGRRHWIASQGNAYLNAIFQTNFEGKATHGINSDHRLSAGISVNYDIYRERLHVNDSLTFDREEVTPGIFAEYDLKVDDKLSLVVGIRGDYSTRYGFFATPRMNVRYSPWEWWAIRASVGLGYRAPNVLSDNAYILPSSRKIIMEATDFAKQERALNTGVSTTFYIPISDRQLSITGEYYYTHFINSVIADMDRDPHAVYLYNQSDIGGRSFSHNAQIEASMEILRGWTMTAAFRYTDVRQTTLGSDGIAKLRLKQLTNRYKGIITTSYQTPLKKWQFDVTAQFNGGGRMPNGFNEYFLSTAPKQYTEGADGTLYYKWYPQLMAQVTKYFRTCSIYLGAENMTNFRQESPIVATDAPYGADFDASMAWGPMTGWKVYLGFRYSLQKPDEE